MFKSVLERAKQARATELEGDEAVEAGFTLIELMVVLLIIAILLAIAIPTFLGVTNSANDRAAQSDLTNALTEAEALYQSNPTAAQSYTQMTTGLMTSSAPEFSWTTGNCLSSTNNCISITSGDAAAAGDGQVLELATQSKGDNKCWYLINVQVTPSTTLTGAITTAGTYYYVLNLGQSGTDGATCTTAGAQPMTLSTNAIPAGGSSFSGAKAA